MITVTKGKVFSRTYDNCQLPDVCLHYAGGGYTAEQTAKAMVAQSELLSGNTAKLNGHKLVMTKE